MPSFIGIDLAWRSEKHSGGAVLHGDQDGLAVREFSNCLKTLNGPICLARFSGKQNVGWALPTNSLKNAQDPKRPEPGKTKGLPKRELGNEEAIDVNLVHQKAES
ncbi:MAG: hypothetical protein ACLPT6_00010 [Desulfobaccales bacterium]